MTNVLVQGLTVDASFSGDPELVMQAVALDPLTSAVLTLAEIREMVAEMLDAEKEWLPVERRAAAVRWAAVTGFGFQAKHTFCPCLNRAIYPSGQA